MGRRTLWRSVIGDAALAVAVALLLAAIWTLRDWSMLSAMHLPDTDDVMRLQQIRDWLAGQAFSDLSQHRLGADGLAMHWSRLPDLVPAAIITQLTPMVGVARAELIAVIAWPTLLFASALFLVAGITRTLDAQAARTALVVAAIGYPVTTLFLPGRIDHHGFQIVLLLVMVRALLARPGQLSGAIIGLAACASLVIGLETAPFILLAAVMLWIGWAAGRPGGQLVGFGFSFGLSLAFASIVFSPDAWTYPACDGFTRMAWEGAQIASFAPILLGMAGRAMPSPRNRIAASGMLGLGLIALLWPTARACAAPYGAVDPMLARLWLGNVGEAQSLLTAPLADSISYLGLLIVGLLASLWCWQRRPQTGWAVLIACQLTALALCFLQLRGAYVGAILAAPALAVVITAARRHGTGWLTGAWLASAGMLYPLAAQAFAVAPAPSVPPESASVAVGCTSPAMMAALRALPPGTIIAPVDLGAYAIAATRHRLIAAPYHRNNAGNAAMYHVFFGTDDAAEQIADRLSADYVVVCDGFGAVDRRLASDPSRLMHQLMSGSQPRWLRPLDRTGPAAQIFAVDHRLSSLPPAL